jgi:hypothetical protein
VTYFTTASRWDLGPTQAPVQWISRALRLGVKLTTKKNWSSASTGMPKLMTGSGSISSIGLRNRPIPFPTPSSYYFLYKSCQTASVV